MVSGKKLKITVICAAAVLAATLTACSGNINGALDQTGAGEFEVNAALDANMAALLAPFSGGGQVLDGPSLSHTMSQAPGIRRAELVNSGREAVAGKVAITHIAEFLSPSAGKDFITMETAGGGGKLGIRLNRENGPEVLSLLSPDITDYLSALMAPIAGYEKLSKDEYLLLVSTIYSPDIAAAIRKAAINATVGFPGPVTSAKGGSFEGSTARFTVPLADLLVLEQPLEYEVVWGPKKGVSGK